MKKRSALPFFSEFQSPIRDLLRGVSGVAEQAEETFGASVELLPSPLKSPIHKALKRLEDASVSVGKIEVTHSDIQIAAEMVSGGVTDRKKIETCVTVLAFAWDHLKPTTGDGEHIVLSETVACVHVETMLKRANAHVECRPADIVIELSQNAIFPHTPSIPRKLSADELFTAKVALTASVVWLLAAREESVEQDVKLLHFSAALTNEFAADLFAAEENCETLTAGLRDLASHL